MRSRQAASPSSAARSVAPTTSVNRTVDSRRVLDTCVPSSLVRLPLGSFVGARSGDKGGDANVGLWIRRSSDPGFDNARYGWLVELLTADGAVTRLLPETAGLAVEVGTTLVGVAVVAGVLSLVAVADGTLRRLRATRRPPAAR